VSPGRRTVLFLLSSLALFAIQWHEIWDLVRYALDTEHTNASQVLLIPVCQCVSHFPGSAKDFQSRSVGRIARHTDCSVRIRSRGGGASDGQTRG
jgi:hypothetical protein